MGGGAAMRAAAKFAGGFGVVSGGMRGGFSAVPPPEHVVTSAARTANAIFSDAKTNAPAVPVPRPEIYDWEFVGEEEEVMSDVSEPLPRLVFGGPPTLEEAAQATSELRTVLDEAYLSSNSGGSYISYPKHDMLALAHSSHLEANTKASPPSHAIQAFKLLNESSAAQTVVASIACDPKVWNAVLENEALVEFLNSKKTNTSFSDMNESSKESAAGAEIPGCQSSSCSDNELYDDDEKEFTNGFQVFLQNIKVRVEEMMSSLSGYFQNLFGVPEAVEGGAKPTFLEKLFGRENAMASSVMGLAVMVIMVVALKRA